MIKLPKMKFASTSKYHQVEELIRGMIESGEAAPGAKLPSEIAIAQEIGAHRLTVNKAMNNLVASGYLCRQLGRGTFVAGKGSSGKQAAAAVGLKTVAILFVGEKASNANVYLASSYYSLCTSLGGYDMMVKTFQVNEFADCDIVFNQKPDICVLFTFKNVEQGDLAYFTKNGIPVLLFNRRLPGLPSVNMENEESSRILTEALIAKGHKCIPLLYSDKNASIQHERLAGYVRAMERNSLTPMPIPLSGWQADSSMAALSKLYDSNVPFSAVVCEGLYLLQGARQWCDRRDLNVALGCLDNWGGAFGMDIPAECSIETPLRDMGTKMGELLIAVLEGNVPPSTEIVIPGKLICDWDRAR